MRSEAWEGERGGKGVTREAAGVEGGRKLLATVCARGLEQREGGRVPPHSAACQGTGCKKGVSWEGMAAKVKPRKCNNGEAEQLGAPNPALPPTCGSA